MVKHFVCCVSHIKTTTIWHKMSDNNQISGTAKWLLQLSYFEQFLRTLKQRIMIINVEKVAATILRFNGLSMSHWYFLLLNLALCMMYYPHKNHDNGQKKLATKTQWTACCFSWILFPHYSSSTQINAWSQPYVGLKTQLHAFLTEPVQSYKVIQAAYTGKHLWKFISQCMSFIHIWKMLMFHDTCQSL